MRTERTLLGCSDFNCDWEASQIPVIWGEAESQKVARDEEGIQVKRQTSNGRPIWSFTVVSRTLNGPTSSKSGRERKFVANTRKAGYRGGHGGRRFGMISVMMGSGASLSVPRSERTKETKEMGDGTQQEGGGGRRTRKAVPPGW